MRSWAARSVRFRVVCTVPADQLLQTLQVRLWKTSGDERDFGALYCEAESRERK